MEAPHVLQIVEQPEWYPDTPRFAKCPENRQAKRNKRQEFDLVHCRVNEECYDRSQAVASDLARSADHWRIDETMLRTRPFQDHPSTQSTSTAAWHPRLAYYFSLQFPLVDYGATLMRLRDENLRRPQGKQSHQVLPGDARYLCTSLPPARSGRYTPY